MKIRTIAAALLSACLAGPSLAESAAEGDAEAGKAISAVCAGCHGADGKAIAPDYPNLAGQHASYMATQLTDFRDGGRKNALMSPMAINLSDTDILNLAAFYAAMPAIEGVSTEENLQHGKDIYRGGISSAGVPACSGCHGPSGLGNMAAAYPALGGQNTEYTAVQLRSFRSSERHNDPSEMMRSLTLRLTDGEIAAVSNYITGLH